VREERQLAAQGVPRARDTVGEWLTERSDQLCRTIKPSTCRPYRGAVQTHLIPTLGHVRLDRLTADRISEAIAVIAQKRFKSGDLISPTTVRRTYDVLNNALERAGIYGHLTSKQTEAAAQAMNARSARRQATYQWRGDGLRRAEPI
jgi:hypothetical protein